MTDNSKIKALISCIDLNNLEPDCDANAVESLCQKAQTANGNIASVTIAPKFVTLAKGLLAKTGIKVAAGIGFPDSSEDTVTLETETQRAIVDGAQEIELLMPYEALSSGRPGFAETQIVRIKRVCGSLPLKVNLQCDALTDAQTIREAGQVALAAGADFIVTSSRAISKDMAMDSAKILLPLMNEAGGQSGIKINADFSSAADALSCFEMTRENTNAEPEPDTFRLGSQKLLDTLNAAL